MNLSAHSNSALDQYFPEKQNVFRDVIEQVLIQQCITGLLPFITYEIFNPLNIFQNNISF